MSHARPEEDFSPDPGTSVVRYDHAMRAPLPLPGAPRTPGFSPGDEPTDVKKAIEQETLIGVASGIGGAPDQKMTRTGVPAITAGVDMTREDPPGGKPIPAETTAESSGTNVVVFSIGGGESLVTLPDERFGIVDRLFESVEDGGRLLDDGFFGEVADMAVIALRQSKRGTDMHKPEKVTAANIVGKIHDDLQWQFNRWERGERVTPFQGGRAYGQFAMMGQHLYGWGRAAERRLHVENNGDDLYDYHAPLEMVLTGERKAERRIAEEKAAGVPIASSRIILDAMSREDWFTSLRGDKGEGEQDGILRALSVGVLPAINNSDAAGLAEFERRMKDMQDNLEGDQYDVSRGIVQGVRDLLQAAMR